MNDDIPFDKNLELAPDVVDEPVPGVRRVMANNPGPFTFKGTVSYILGRGKVAIVDPGPDDPAHGRGGGCLDHRGRGDRIRIRPRGRGDGVARDHLRWHVGAWRPSHGGGQIAYFVMAVTVTVNHPTEQPYLKG